MKKKDRERRAFDLVFDEAAYKEVVAGDEPDFVVHINDDACFGVEVTELWRSESEARLHHIPDYFSRLIAGEPHVHKDDIDSLPVSSATLYDSTGQLKGEDVPCILSRGYTVSEFVDLVLETLRRKSLRLSAYFEKAPSLILILEDVTSTLSAPTRQLWDILFSGSLREFLYRTRMDEVLILTTAFDQGEVVLPLRHMLLAEEAARMKYVLHTINCVVEEDQLNQLLTRYLKCKGAGVRLDVSGWARLGAAAVDVRLDGNRLYLGYECPSFDSDGGIVVPDFVDILTDDFWLADSASRATLKFETEMIFHAR